jgi:hypothetical protein
LAAATPSALTVERKRLVIDANILIRGCLGVRVRALIADYADRVDFFVAEANVPEAAHYISDLAREKNLDEAACTEALLSLMRVVQMVETPCWSRLARRRWPGSVTLMTGLHWLWGCSWSAQSGRRTRFSLAPALRPGPAAQWSAI